MNLPFSHDAFLDVFAAYNTALWPAEMVLWLATAAVAVGWFASRRIGARAAFALLAVHWAWSGIAYHWVYFRTINRAAILFGMLFVAQAVLFVWVAIEQSGNPTATVSGVRRILGGTFLAYGLVYPLVGLAFDLRYPRMPVFAVPCPTTLVTAGLVIASNGIPRVVNFIPILWAGIGSSAAFALGIRADLALVAAGAALLLDTVAPGVFGNS